VKHLSLILNFVLLIAVAVLYYLHFSSTGSQAAVATNDTTEVTAPVELPEIRTAGGAIAYINYDSLTEKYEFFKQGLNSLESTFKRKEDEFAKKQNDYREAVERYQQLAPTMTPDAAAAREQQLLAQQQSLVELGEKLSDDLKIQQEKFNKQFLKSIDDYLKELSKQKNYSYVFTYSKGGPASIVFANDSLEITKEVISGLNKAYKNKKGK
jgi:outer membrane protein